jgi:hypothetical protein
MDGFLTDKEVEELTGLKRPASQSEWLQREKILHFVNTRNKVKVTWHSVNNPSVATKRPDFSKVS